MLNDKGDSAAIVAAVTAAYTLGVLGGNMQPLVIGALIDGLHMDAGRAGLLGSIELAAVALSSFVLAPRMGTISRRAIVLVGAALAALGYCGSALPQSFGAFIPLRLLAGAGAGIVLAIGNAAVSACHHPDRVFARMTFAGTIVITAVLTLLPMFIVRFGYRGGYVGMGMLCIVLLPLLLWIPDAVAHSEAHAGVAAGEARLGLATLVAAALLFFSQSAIWAFSERVAMTAHLNHQQTGLALSGSTLAGLGGAALAAYLGTRSGRTLPLTAGVLTTGLTLVALVHTATPTAYIAVLTVNGVAYLFMVPYLLGTAAALDRQGRWAAATIGAATVGAAIGPGVAGPVVQAGGYAALGWLVLMASVVSAVAVFPVARSLDRRARAQMAPS